MHLSGVQMELKNKPLGFAMSHGNSEDIESAGEGNSQKDSSI
jgi:hypothetical protein